MLLSIFAGTFRNNVFADFLNNQLTITGLYCRCFHILIMLPSGEGNGEAAIAFKDIKYSDIAISWPVILMCAVTIPLASAMIPVVAPFVMASGTNPMIFGAALITIH